MDERPARILLLFLDGVGMGDDDARTNPLVRANLPCLRTLLGGGLPVRGAHAAPAAPARLAAADASLGVPGKPQSGTGQTALLTGFNAAERMGRHFGPWVPTPLRVALARENLLSRAVAAGRRAAFANAYPAGHTGPAGRRRPAAPPLAALAAGVLSRHADALREGRAVASSITNEAWRIHLDPGVPSVTPRQAGANLARIAAAAEITLFAHYDTDHAGHRREMPPAVLALERVDAFLAGVVADLPADALLVVASDHGNVEDVTAGHTLNPVPVLALGPGAGEVARRTRAITDVAPALLDLLGIERNDAE